MAFHLQHQPHQETQEDLAVASAAAHQEEPVADLAGEHFRIKIRRSERAQMSRSLLFLKSLLKAAKRMVLAHSHLGADFFIFLR